MSIRVVVIASTLALSACSASLESTKRAGPVPDAMIVAITRDGKTFTAEDKEFDQLARGLRADIPRYVHTQVVSDGNVKTAFNGYFTVSGLNVKDRTSNKHYVLDPTKYDDVCNVDLGAIDAEGEGWLPANVGSDFKPHGIWYGAMNEAIEGWHPKMVAITRVSGSRSNHFRDDPSSAASHDYITDYSIMIVVRSGCTDVYDGSLPEQHISAE